jgi:hypothetical protein
MEGYLVCQSCGRPIDRPDILGTEKDHSKSTIYCLNCYRNGEFTHPELTLRKMRRQLTAEMHDRHASEEVIAGAVSRLPHLSRWLGIPAIHHHRQWH